MTSWGTKKKDDCPHNMGLICPEHCGCGRCGWNPPVALKRKERLREAWEARQRQEESDG